MKRFLEWFSHTWLGLRLWPLYLVLDEEKTFRITRMKGTEITCKQFINTIASQSKVQIKSKAELRG